MAAIPVARRDTGILYCFGHAGVTDQRTEGIAILNGLSHRDDQLAIDSLIVCCEIVDRNRLHIQTVEIKIELTEALRRDRFHPGGTGKLLCLRVELQIYIVMLNIVTFVAELWVKRIS